MARPDSAASTHPHASNAAATDPSRPAHAESFPYAATPIGAASPYAAQPVVVEGDATGGVIPYKNPSALIAYYLGIFSLFPVIGFPLGVASIILGVKGLKARRLQPIIKGTAHAWVGIICGLLGMVFHLPFGFGLIAAIIAAASR